MWSSVDGIDTPWIADLGKCLSTVLVPEKLVENYVVENIMIIHFF